MNPMQSHTTLILLSSLILTVGYLSPAKAVTDAELEALEKQIEQLETDEEKQAEAAAKRKAEAEKLAEEKKRLEEERAKLEEEKRKLEEARLAELERQRREEEAKKQAEEVRQLAVKEGANPLNIIVKNLTANQRKELDIDDHGIYVEKVNAGQASKAGIREGDVILLINNKKVMNLEHFNQLINKLPRKRSIPILIVRNGSPLFLALRY